VIYGFVSPGVRQSLVGRGISEVEAFQPAYGLSIGGNLDTEQAKFRPADLDLVICEEWMARRMAPSNMMIGYVVEASISDWNIVP
jgi:hypothetical protein